MKMCTLAFSSLLLVACSHAPHDTVKRKIASEDEPVITKLSLMAEGESAGILGKAALKQISRGQTDDIWFAKKTDKCAAEIGHLQLASYDNRSLEMDYVVEMTGACLPFTFAEGKESAELMVADQTNSSVLLAVASQGGLGGEWLGAGNVDLIELEEGEGYDWKLKSHITSKQISDTALTRNDCEQGLSDAWYSPAANKLVVSYGQRVNLLSYKDGKVSQTNLLGAVRPAGGMIACAAMAYGFGKNERARAQVLSANDGTLVIVDMKNPSKSRKIKL